MKQLFLAIVILATTVTSAFADKQPTKAGNDAAMKAGRTALASKIVELDNNVSSRNMALAQTTAVEVLNLMRKGMAQTQVKLNLESHDKQQEVNNHYLKMERLTYEFQNLSQNVSANGPELVRNAQSFLLEY